MEYLTLRDIPQSHYNSRTMPSSHQADRPMGNVTAVTHHMRSSPPIQPGEQSYPAKLPSFSEFLHTTRATTPPRTPSRRNGSTDSSPQAKPHFDDVAWAHGKRRRVDTLGDIYSRPSPMTEHSTLGARRLSTTLDNASAYAVHRGSQQHDGPAPTFHSHHRQSSNSYPPLSHPPAPVMPFRPQLSPSATQANRAHEAQRQNMAAHPYGQQSSVYDHRHSYAMDPHTPSAMFGYDASHDGFYPRSTYPSPAYDGSYGEVRFHHNIGMDQNSFNRKRRGNLPKEATNVLKEWFSLNRASPYPTEDQKIELCTRTGLSLNQVSNWFINARRRAPQKEQREREANTITETQ